MKSSFLVTYWEERCCSGYRFREFEDTDEDRASMESFIKDCINDSSIHDVKACKISVVVEYDIDIKLIPKHKQEV